MFPKLDVRFNFSLLGATEEQLKPPRLTFIEYRFKINIYIYHIWTQLGLYSRFNHLYILMSTLYMSLYLHLFIFTNTKCVPMTEVKRKQNGLRECCSGFHKTTFVTPRQPTKGSRFRSLVHKVSQWGGNMRRSSAGGKAWNRGGLTGS